MEDPYFSFAQSNNLENCTNEHPFVSKSKVRDELLQQFNRIVAQGELFFDTDFTPNNGLMVGSSPLHPYFKDVKSTISGWKRPTELSSDAQLFVNGTVNTDVIQGLMGDCYLLSSFAILGDYHWIEDLFVGYSKEAGVAAVILYKDGVWRGIIVDDLLPVDLTNQLIFGRSTDPNEFWVSLLEKAYAKLHGSYEAINTGAGSNALEDLTGGIGRTFNIRGRKEQQSIDLVWSKVNQLSDQYFLTISRSSDPDKVDQGITGSHCYSIIKGLDLNGTLLVKIRNPWGKGEWTGDWSDHSTLWTDELKEMAEWSDQDEGTFYISVADLIKQYDLLSECIVYDQSWSYLRMETRMGYLSVIPSKLDLNCCLSVQQSDQRVGKWPERYVNNLQIQLIKDNNEVVGPAAVRRVYRTYPQLDPGIKEIKFTISDQDLSDRMIRVEIYYLKDTQ